MNVLGISVLLGTFHSRLILANVNESCSKTNPVGDTCEQQSGNLVQFILHAREMVSLGVCICKLCVDLRFAKVSCKPFGGSEQDHCVF